MTLLLLVACKSLVEIDAAQNFPALWLDSSAPDAELSFEARIDGAAMWDPAEESFCDVDLYVQTYQSTCTDCTAAVYATASVTATDEAVAETTASLGVEAGESGRFRVTVWDAASRCTAGETCTLGLDLALTSSDVANVAGSARCSVFVPERIADEAAGGVEIVQVTAPDLEGTP
jgi:hypothetical protein